MPSKPNQIYQPRVLKQIDACVRAIRKKTKFKPDFCCVLGTGLGSLAKQVKPVAVFDYSKLPHFPATTVRSHRGQLVLGELEGRNVAMLEGRFHLYEGYSAEEVVFPVRVCRFLGASSLIVTNASGGLNPAYQLGELVAIQDHINFLGVNPLTGPNDDRVGPRFPDMSEPYARDYLKTVCRAAKSLKLDLQEGVYLAIPGPNLETRAEYRMIRGWGADLVGMSTVPEVIAAVHAGMKVLGLSVVTDLCDPENLKSVDIKEIIKVANQAGPRLDKLIRQFLKSNS
ncbi:MAG TPA: purine-nucleoside phosphorylase [Candidatus Omnitrophica bacterium]|nr:purine-nucleoside phosphorylase [Candidatus Omnitrophota bacterium]